MLVESPRISFSQINIGQYFRCSCGHFLHLCMAGDHQGLLQYSSGEFLAFPLLGRFGSTAWHALWSQRFGILSRYSFCMFLSPRAGCPRMSPNSPDVMCSSWGGSKFDQHQTGVIADKYQVLELRDLCLKMVEDLEHLLQRVALRFDRYMINFDVSICCEWLVYLMTAFHKDKWAKTFLISFYHWPQDALGEDVKNAWVIFQSADRLQLKGFRKKSKDKILIEAKAAFESRPLVKQELLDEVLGSNLFCITDQELFDLLSKWTDAQGQISSKTLIGKWVSMDKVSVAEQNFKVDDCNETKSMRKRGEHTNDLLCGVKDRFIRDVASKIVHSEAGRMLFLTDWVCAVFGWRDVTKFHDSIYGLANGEQSVTLLKDLWIEWRLPKFAAHLIAIKFTQEFTKDDHLEIFCAADCSGWQRVFSSKDHDCLIAKDAVVPCECEGMVQRFRIQIVSGQYPIKCVKFEVILRQISYLEIWTFDLKSLSCRKDVRSRWYTVLYLCLALFAFFAA